MATVFAGIGTLSALILIVLLIWSLCRPDARWWPPRSGGIGSETLVVWTTSILPFLAGGLAGLMDPATLGLTSVVWRVVGLASMVAGGLLLAWAIGTLSWAQSLGRGEALITHGPYRFSRNPQYIGDLVLITGFVLWADSPLALSVAIPIGVAVCLFPRTEEPWLAELFGNAYTEYRRRTPRFVGFLRHN